MTSEQTSQDPLDKTKHVKYLLHMLNVLPTPYLFKLQYNNYYFADMQAKI